jgi:hypothetical protein
MRKILTGLVLAASVAALVACMPGAELLVPRTIRITVSGDLGTRDAPAPPGPPHEVLVVERGMLRPNLEVPVRATLTIEDVGVLRSLRLKVGTDRDGDHVIEDGEWDTVASGDVREEGGVTTATLGPVGVGIRGHVYRLEQDRVDEGVVWNEHIVDAAYTTSDWER